MKICTICKINKELSEFNKNKKRKDGYGTECKICLKIYYKENINKFKIHNNSYYKLNVDKFREYRKINRINRKNNSIDKISKIARRLVKRRLQNKTSKKTIEILGCTSIDFITYLELKFESWMNWDNYGKYNGKPNFGWDIDHIIPISKAKTEEQAFILSHYTNFQPLCSYINRCIKRNK